MQTIELTISVDDDLQELLIAELSDLDFDAFVQEDGYLKAYLPRARWDDTRREHVERWLSFMNIPPQVVERIYEPENWNARWEETIKPVAVEPFLIKPTWAEAPAGYRHLILLEIDPKMSFGTGYHESTRLALRFLPRWIQKGDFVLDAGAGTGILAVAALKLGAARAIAFDNDEWAQQNCVENFYLNRVQQQSEFRSGSLEQIYEDSFDVILANINRNVLLEFLPAFAEKLRSGGRVIMAGLLAGDREHMRDAAAGAGLEVVEEAAEGEWWAAVLQR